MMSTDIIGNITFIGEVNSKGQLKARRHIRLNDGRLVLISTVVLSSFTVVLLEKFYALDQHMVFWWIDVLLLYKITTKKKKKNYICNFKPNRGLVLNRRPWIIWNKLHTEHSYTRFTFTFRGFIYLALRQKMLYIHLLTFFKTQLLLFHIATMPH